MRACTEEQRSPTAPYPLCACLIGVVARRGQPPTPRRTLRAHLTCLHATACLYTCTSASSAARMLSELFKTNIHKYIYLFIRIIASASSTSYY